MKRTIRKEFSMVPSVQLRSERPAPTYLTPAIPIRLNDNQKSLIYAQVDTGAQMCCISKSLIANMLRMRSQYVGEILVDTFGGQRHLKILKINVVICDQDEAPWLRLDDVPFAVLDSNSLAAGHTGIILGYDSFLSHIRLTLDYPKGKLIVSAPRKLLASQTTVAHPHMPTRIREAEALARSGGFTSAVVLLAAGLEEVLEEFSGQRLKKNFWLGDKRVAEQILPKNLSARMSEIRELRNRAVHGKVGARGVKPEEARRAIQNAKTIIVFLQSMRSDRNK
jgi:hypothetical protein